MTEATHSFDDTIKWGDDNDMSKQPMFVHYHDLSLVQETRLTELKFNVQFGG